MQAEAARELLGLQRHGFVPGALSVILPGEGHRLVLLVQGPEAARTEGDPMGVARQIGQDWLGAGKGPLGIDDPLWASRLAQQPGEGMGLGQRTELAVELELSLRIKLLQSRAELGAKNFREGTDGKEVLGR